MSLRHYARPKLSRSPATSNVPPFSAATDRPLWPTGSGQLIAEGKFAVASDMLVQGAARDIGQMTDM